MIQRQRIARRRARQGRRRNGKKMFGFRITKRGRNIVFFFILELKILSYCQKMSDDWLKLAGYSVRVEPKTGRKYYADHRTRSTQWNRPLPLPMKKEEESEMEK